jgi:hypothetical protein
MADLVSDHLCGLQDEVSDPDRALFHNAKRVTDMFPKLKPLLDADRNPDHAQIIRCF